MARTTLEVGAEVRCSVEKAARTVRPERCCAKATASELQTLTAQKGQERKEREAAEAREKHVQRMKQLAPQEQAYRKASNSTCNARPGNPTTLPPKP